MIELKNISESFMDKNIVVCGRINKIRSTGKILFVILRDQIYSIQCVCAKNDSFKKIPPESFVMVSGKLTKLPEHVPSVISTYHKRFEIRLSDIEIISESKSEYPLPFILEDVNQLYGSKDRSTVLLNTRLNFRYFDLRAPFNNCIFKIKSMFSHLFRNYLMDQDFCEIHTPKLISTASEGGAAVFKLDYFGSAAYLAQSPQLYKQMCINSDFNKVFEIGPIFRAENCISQRHLCEFIGLDIEMVLTPGETYHQIINLAWSALITIFNKILISSKKELEYIKSIHPFEDPIYSEKPLIIEFKDAVKLLQDNGFEQNISEDLSTSHEAQLGVIIKSKYKQDLFVLDKFPSGVRPFYTMPCSLESKFSNSFDIIFRGQEISSGSQRINNYEILMKRFLNDKLKPELFKDYLDSFKYGSRPHGGCGFGLERIVMLYLKIDNIKECSIFPRDPNRITP